MTTWNDIELLIVGAGTMGASLAQNYAQNGFAVGLIDVSETALARGVATIERELNAVRGKIFSSEECDAIRGRIVSGTSYEDACASKKLRLVIEAATERIDVKKKIFAQLDELCVPEAVLATNSSSLDSNQLTDLKRHADRVVWMHYFYLPHKNRGGEYAATDKASPEALAVARKYMKLGGKISTYVRGSRKGGVADIIFVALLLEAARMVEEGFALQDIEAAAKKAYGIPMGFLELMDATGIPIGLYSMDSFSDATDKSDPLFKVYGNFYKAPKGYVDLVRRFEQAENKSTVRWINGDAARKPVTDVATVANLTDRFLAVGIATSTECVNAGLITIPDLDVLCQNAFLWKKGPFQLMNELGKARVREVIEKRSAIACDRKQDFPVCDLLKKEMAVETPWNARIPLVESVSEQGGAVRRITLMNAKAANAVNNTVFAELDAAFTDANNDKKCKAIIFDTAPIKSFIAGADIPAFIERVKREDYDAIVKDTAEWQRVIFHVMTGTDKPKVVIIDGQAFGGGVEIACAFALDPKCVVIGTNRTSYALPEVKLGIYPGLRGTLSLAQVIHKHTGDAEGAVALARYFMLTGGVPSSSPQVLAALGLIDVLVPQHRRDDAAATIAQAIVDGGGKIPAAGVLATLKMERLPMTPTLREEQELLVAKDVFSRPDMLTELTAMGRGRVQTFYTGAMKEVVTKAARRVATSSPHAVCLTNYLISRGFRQYLRGVDNDTLAAWELDHHLASVFEHPDALIGLEAVTRGAFPEFTVRYPF